MHLEGVNQNKGDSRAMTGQGGHPLEGGPPREIETKVRKAGG